MSNPHSCDWFYLQDGQHRGPTSILDIVARVQKDEFTGRALVWKAGMSAWTPLASLPEFKTAFEPKALRRPKLPPKPRPVNSEQNAQLTTAPFLKPDSKVWYYEVNGANQGPFSTIALRKSIQKGSIAPATKIWREHMEAWKPAEELEEFADVRVNKLKLTRPPMAPHLKHQQRKGVLPGDNPAAKTVNFILNALSIEGGLTILAALLIAGFFFLQIPEAPLKAFWVYIAYAGSLGIVCLGRALACHWGWLLAVLLVPLGVVVYLIWDFRKTWRLIIALILCGSIAGVGYNAAVEAGLLDESGIPSLQDYQQQPEAE
ncbi:DUF4339 domain-containing protein [Cerasicoccus maritimus]|uniref:DUF4339 domain-containing protein n=1 Tax=Cerasicoccus maritimus TaxID=490089 RepID=UPI002852D2CF|nr:DUF4339 domain-containing protein [Cerasicoccus maritimus]